MTTETPPVSPLANPRMLARIIAVQIDTKQPTRAQLGALTSFILRHYPDAAEDGPREAVASVAESVVLEDARKVEILTVIKDALKSGDFTPLLDEATGGEAPPEPASPPPGRINPLAPRSSFVESAATGAAPQDAASLMARAIQLLQEGAKPSTWVDEDKVKALVDESLGAHRDAMARAVAEQVDRGVKEAEARLAGRGVHRIEIIHPEGRTVELEGATHWQFEEILSWLAANVPVWLWGKAGGGKTHLGRQLAAVLEIPAHIVSIDPTMTVGKLVGYRNLATGEYVPGLLTAAYRDGGLLMLDEIDTGDPGIIACLNSLLANGHFLFPCGTTIARHSKFRVIAGANTKGTGAVAGYTARQRLDAATLNRFAILELKYDERLEEILALGSSSLPRQTWVRGTPDEDRCRSWVEWVRKVRSSVGDAVLISPRASYLGVAALRAGIPMAEVAAALVFALVSSDTQRSITSTCGLP